MTRRTARHRRRLAGRGLLIGGVGLGHLLLFVLINSLTPRAPIPFASDAIDVSLWHGGGGLGMAAAPPAPRPTAAETPVQEVAEPTPAPEPAVDVTAAPDVVEPPPEPTPSAEDAAPSEPPPEDVLAAAQALIGAEGVAATAEAGVSTAGSALPGGSKCEAGQMVMQALLDDPAAMKALAGLPPSGLSVAGALQLWDGQSWADEARLGGPGATLPVREAVVRALAHAPPECLTTAFVGPRFLILPLGARSVVLVFGSGEWRWAEAVARSGVVWKPAAESA